MTKKLHSKWLLSLAFAVSALGCEDESVGLGNAIECKPTGGTMDGGLPGQIDAALAPGAAPDAGTPVTPALPVDGADAAAPVTPPPAAGPTPPPAPPCNAAEAPKVPKLALESLLGRERLESLQYAAQPKGSNDWYLVQQSGVIRVLSEGQLRPEPLLDVSSEIDIEDEDDERGLLGLAFPSDFVTSGKFYVMLTPSEGEERNRELVREYQRVDGAPPMLTKVLLRTASTERNHNGGHLAFGPDGLLYASTGDGGGECSPKELGDPQDPKSLYGKILRLDPNGSAEGPEPYAAAGNPFSGEAGDSRVLHYGLRNPFRFSFDRAMGGLYIGDVGQGAFEEVSFAAQGEQGLNFGWPAFQGLEAGTCKDKALREGAAHRAPIVNIDRRGNARGDFADFKAIVGGPVYRGTAIEGLAGAYLFGDYMGRRVGAVFHCGEQVSPPATILKNPDTNAPEAPVFGWPEGLPPFRELTAIVEDNAGELYFVTNRARFFRLVQAK